MKMHSDHINSKTGPYPSNLKRGQRLWTVTQRSLPRTGDIFSQA
uniref:Uncharacterized protein n=1 Tax=Anguilla anguilla TaxID=7936 RepID=A0A0E9PKZ1_ANGAN